LSSNTDWLVAILAPSGFAIKLTGDPIDTTMLSGVSYSLAMVCYSKKFFDEKFKLLKEHSMVASPSPIDVWIYNNLILPGECLLPLEILGKQRPSFSDIERETGDYGYLFDTVNDKIYQLWVTWLFA
jgi:hypothetical protein